MQREREEKGQTRKQNEMGVYEREDAVFYIVPRDVTMAGSHTYPLFLVLPSVPTWLLLCTGPKAK